MEDIISRYIEVFKVYVDDYDMSNVKIKRKYEHSLRVMELQKKYAKLLGFEDEDIELAILIGLLHDIGRFEQLRIYDSFDDLTTIDHALYSVEQLFTKNQIIRFTNRDDWYPIIEFAIKNHNKVDIPNIDNERILKHARLIRDTDKVDIMVAMVGRAIEDKSSVSSMVMNLFKMHGLIDRKYAKTKSDFIVNQYGFVFNIYNDIVLEEYKQNFIKFHESIKDNEKFIEAYEEVIKYIDERIEKYDGNRNKI